MSSPEEPSFQNVEEFLKYLDSLQADQAEVLRQIKKDDEELNILERRLKLVRGRKNERELNRSALARKMKETSEAMDALKRKLALEAEERRVRELADARRSTLDEAMQNAVWKDYILPHQKDGAYYLSAAKRAICADVMGLGKTFQAIATLKIWTDVENTAKKVLIAMPNEVVSNFVDEFDRWEPDRPIINLAAFKSIPEVIENIRMYTDFLSEWTFLINYEKLARSNELVELLISKQPDTIVCDEAHKLKNTSRNTYQAIEKLVLSHNTCPICHKATFPMHKDGTSTKRDFKHRQGLCQTDAVVDECTRSVVNYMSMTGTPILNRPEEIYSSLHLVNDEAFPTLHDFLEDHCWIYGQNDVRWKPGGEARLISKIKGMYIRRTRDDAGIKLPPQKIQVHTIEIDKTSYPLQSKILEALAKHAQIEIEEGRASSVLNIMTLITRQRQAAVWPGGISIKHTDPVSGHETVDHIGSRYLESAKLDRAVELYQELCIENGERVVYFSQFKEPLIELKKRLGDKAVEFHGDTPTYLREAIKRNFDRSKGEDPKWNAVLAHYRLGGEGLNLTAATQVVILDEQWNPGMNEQAYQRVQRMGQTQETGVHILRLDESIDDWMAGLIERKRKVVDGFNTEFTFAELADIFKNFDK